MDPFIVKKILELLMHWRAPLQIGEGSLHKANEVVFASESSVRCLTADSLAWVFMSLSTRV